MVRFLLPVFLFLSACAGVSAADEAHSSRPGWVDGKGRDEFPEEKYVIAVGSGKDRKAAENDAKRALAERFRAKVSSETESAAHGEITDNTDASTSGSSKENLQSSLKVTTSIELRGIQILRRYEDPQSHDFFALAGIDRLKVRSSYQMELMKRKRRIDALVSSFNAKPSVAKGKKVLAELNVFEALSEEAESVGAGMPVTDILSEDRRDAIEEKLEELRSKYVVELKVKGDDENDVEDLLGSCLTEEGLSLAGESDSKPTHKVSVTFRQKDKKVKVEGWSKIEFTLQISVPGVRKKVVSKEASGRSKEHAFDQIREDLIKQACEYIVNSVSK